MIDFGKIIDLIKDPDLKLKINDLYKENLQLKEENFELKRKLEEEHKLQDIKSKLVHEDNHYFLLDGENRIGPLCTKCSDADNKMIRLHKGNYHNGVQYYDCPNCKTTTAVGKEYISNQNSGNWLY